MNKFYLSLILITSIGLTIESNAQSNDLLAKTEFMAADEAYGAGQYDETIQRLEKAIELLGQTNPRIQYLLAKSYYAKEDITKAEQELTKYFEISEENDRSYNEMTYLYGQINKTKKEISEMNTEWDLTKSINTKEAYSSFQKKYPDNPFSTEITTNIKNIEKAELDAQIPQNKLRYESLIKLSNEAHKLGLKKKNGATTGYTILGLTWGTAIVSSAIMLIDGDGDPLAHDAAAPALIGALAGVLSLSFSPWSKKRQSQDYFRKAEQYRREANGLYLGMRPQIDILNDNYGLGLVLRF